MSQSASNVVLLGHTGFLGRHLQRHLEAQGVEVHGYSSRALDLRRSEALSVLDAVVNADTTLVLIAALTPDKGATLETFSDNVAMVTNVARYVQAGRVGQCVYFSSDAVYPMTDVPISEATCVAPEGFYALAKYVGERVLSSTLAASATPLLVLRPTAVFGPGDTHNSYGPNRFVRSVVTDRVVRIFGSGDDVRDHLYIDDLVALAAALIQMRAQGEFILATGVSRSFASIVEDLRAIVPYTFEVVEQPRSGPRTTRRFDIGRLLNAVGDISFAPFRDALRTTFEYASTTYT